MVFYLLNDYYFVVVCGRNFLYKYSNDLLVFSGCSLKELECGLTFILYHGQFSARGVSLIRVE